MDINDIKNYIIRHNLNIPGRHMKKVDQRMYLYAYIYHYLKIDNLSTIGEMFKINRGSVRNALIKVVDIQFDDTYIQNTKELNYQIPFIAPKYNSKNIKANKKHYLEKKGKQYQLKIQVTKEVYFEYMRKQNTDIVFDYLFRLMLKEAPKLNKSRNPYKKSN
jgi:hypothetical protein